MGSHGNGANQLSHGDLLISRELIESTLELIADRLVLLLLLDQVGFKFITFLLEFSGLSLALSGASLSVLESGAEIEKVPNVLAALSDPLCSPTDSESYSSSPLKSSEAGDSCETVKSSSCEWSDLIEQDERERLEAFKLDSQELSSKLSGLELGSGGSRGTDSGVVSPSEEFMQAEAAQEET